MAMQTTSDNLQGEPMMEMNMTPLIDVLLVLLIMFIITIPIQTHAVKLDLPQSSDAPPPVEPIKNKVVVTTAGGLGGWAQPGGPYKAAAPPGPFEDAYGAGDCFAAGLTFALAKGLEIADALAFASERGALALTRRGAGLEG